LWVKAKTVTMWSTVYGFLVLDRARRFKPFMIEPLGHAHRRHACGHWPPAS